MTEEQLDFFTNGTNIAFLPTTRWSATLGKFLPVSEGKSEPPWAQRNFSHAFTGVVPLECYEDIIDEMDACRPFGS